jgi:hypothetical protein
MERWVEMGRDGKLSYFVVATMCHSFSKCRKEVLIMHGAWHSPSSLPTIRLAVL